MLKQLPLFIRKAIVDAVEGFVGAALALTWTGSTDALGQALAVAAAVAVVAALRRNMAAGIDWLKDQLGIVE